MADAPRPSGTVVLVRDATAGPELLLLQRGGRDGKPGPWVFPGGKVEPHDVVDDDPGSMESARLASARETIEEAGVDITPQHFAAISRWITPEISPRRFDTWFFLAAQPEGQAVRVDGGEIVDHRWVSPPDALSAHEEGALQLAPPTFVTVTWLAEFESARHALEVLPRRELVTFRPRICRTESGAVMLYPGDAGYDAHDPERSGSRHRVIASAGFRYRYERSR